MKVAIAGLGAAATRGHIPALLRIGAAAGTHIVAAADPRSQRRDAGASLLPGIPMFTAAEQMLSAIDCDTLLVAADTPAHGALVELGLYHDKHIICEKPFVLTPTDQERLARTAVRSSLAIISVHQYRFAPPAVVLARAARVAARLRRPFSVSVDVCRPGPDPQAVTGWRTDPRRSGGILADHGVHYLALAWTIDEHLDVLAASRTRTADGERGDVLLRVGPGTQRIRLVSGVPQRSTSVALNVGDLTLTWNDDRLEFCKSQRLLWRSATSGLSSRPYVDTLYERFHSDVVRNIKHRIDWRDQRTAETLMVTRTLLSLLADTDVFADS